MYRFRMKRNPNSHFSLIGAKIHPTPIKPSQKLILHLLLCKRVAKKSIWRYVSYGIYTFWTTSEAILVETCGEITTCETVFVTKCFLLQTQF